MRNALRQHWPEYLMEAAGLGIFMLSAGIFATILEYHGFPVRELIDQAWTRRFLMGLSMGLTAVAVIYSPWGKQSGAPINSAVTLTFFRLGKIKPWDAVFYVVAQFFGGALGILIVALAFGAIFSAPEVNYVATVPGPDGAAVAERRRAGQPLRRDEPTEVRRPIGAPLRLGRPGVGGPMNLEPFQCTFFLVQQKIIEQRRADIVNAYRLIALIDRPRKAADDRHIVVKVIVRLEKQFLFRVVLSKDEM